MSIFDEIYNRSAADGNAILSAYVKSGADKNAKNYEGKSVLFAAASMGLTDGVKILIDAGANLNTTTNDGDTALCVAIGNGEMDIAELLIKAKADVNLGRSYGGKTALMLAADRGNRDIVNLLLKARAALNEKDNNGRSASDYATQSGNTDVIKLLSQQVQDSPSKDLPNDYLASLTTSSSPNVTKKKWWEFWK